MNQNQPQRPGQARPMQPNQSQGNIPPHRANEMQQQYQELQRQNREMRAMLDHVLLKQNQPQGNGQPQPPKQGPFAPEVQTALDAYLKEQLDGTIKPLAQRYEQQIGYLSDQLDEAKFQSKWGDAGLKYNDKISQIREEYGRQGRYLSREDAFKHIYFEENARKPKEPTVQVTPVGPQVDPYTGQQVAPTQEMPQEQQFEQAPQEDYQEPNQLGPQGQASFDSRANFPQQNNQWAPNRNVPAPANYQQRDFNLSPATPNSQAQMTPPAQNQRLSFDTDEAAMDQWAKKYGNVPL